MIAKIFFKRVILHIHGGRFQDFYERSNCFSKFLIRFIFSQSTKIFALSSSWKRCFSKIVHNSKISVIQNFVNFVPDTPILHKEFTVHVLFVGGSGAIGKGLFDIVNAIPLVIKKYEDVHFNFVACAHIKELPLLLKKKKIIDFVTITDFLQGKDKENLFHNSNILFCPVTQKGFQYKC